MTEFGPVENPSQVREAIAAIYERIDSLDVSSLSLTESRNELDRYIQERLITYGVRIARVVTEISAASDVTDLGSGIVKLTHERDVTSVDDLEIAAFNISIKTYPVGTLIAVVQVNDSFFVCSDPGVFVDVVLPVISFNPGGGALGGPPFFEWVVGVPFDFMAFSILPYVVISDALDGGGEYYLTLSATAGNFFFDAGDSGVTELPGSTVGTITLVGTTLSLLQDLLSGSTTGELTVTPSVPGTDTLTVTLLETGTGRTSTETLGARITFGSQTHAVYVSKIGDDDNDGLSVNTSKLTIAFGVSAADDLITGGADNVSINVLDAGTYTEDVTLSESVSLYMPAATLEGRLILDVGCSANIKYHYAREDAGGNAAPIVDVVTDSGKASFYRASILDGRGLAGTFINNDLVSNGSSGRVLFVEIGQAFVPQGGNGIKDQSGGTGFGHIHFLIQDLYLAGNNARGLRTNNANTNLIGYIDHILEINAPTGSIGISMVDAGAIVKVTVTEIIADEVYNISAGSLYIVCSKLTGTKTGTPIFTFGTIVTQDANAVVITGGSITGITDLAVADGGTGASTGDAAGAALGHRLSYRVSASGTGGNYTLTTTPAALDQPTTDPIITIAQAGTYKITAGCLINYVGATFPANRVVTCTLHRTNNTPADLTGIRFSNTCTTDIVTTVTGTLDRIFLAADGYVTANADDIITIFASIDTLPTAGTIVATQAWILAERIV